MCDATTIKILCGNKCDMEGSRLVQFDDMKEQEAQLEFRRSFETSALPQYRQTILEMFNKIAQELHEQGHFNVDTHKSESFKLKREAP